MSRRRRHRTARHRSPGWDIVRTPFGARLVPRGRGWAEAVKWTLWTTATLALAAAALAVIAWAAARGVLVRP